MINKEYFGIKVEVWKIDSTWHPYPWRFRLIEPCGKTHVFAGVPNQCESPKSALKRAWYRAKWIKQGTYNQKYL